MSNLDLEYTGSGSGKRYTIASKIKVVEAIKASKCSINSIGAQVGVSNQVITSWVGDYDMGKFTLDNTTQIVRKAKTSLQVIMEKYDAEAHTKRQEFLDAVRIIQEAGLKVA